MTCSTADDGLPSLPVMPCWYCGFVLLELPPAALPGEGSRTPF